MTKNSLKLWKEIDNIKIKCHNIYEDIESNKTIEKNENIFIITSSRINYSKNNLYLF